MMLGLYGLFAQQYILVFLAFFVYLGAARESTATENRVMTSGVPVRSAMIREFHKLTHGDTIRDAAKNPNASGGRSGLYSGPMPKAGGGLNGGSPGSQGSGGTFGNGYEILTPTEGVDFSDYMSRVVAAVRRNGPVDRAVMTLSF